MLSAMGELNISEKFVKVFRTLAILWFRLTVVANKYKFGRQTHMDGAHLLTTYLLANILLTKKFAITTLKMLLTILSISTIVLK